MENFFKVKLRSQVTNIVVAFDVVPDVSESRAVDYKQFNPVHSPGSIYSYSHTQSRMLSINNARLISRTPYEASQNLARLNILRSWTMPYFGSNGVTSTNAGSSGAIATAILGSPPDVLSFYAFAQGPTANPSNTIDTNSTSKNTGATTTSANAPKQPTNLQNIPVVINNLQITYPSDVDYVPTQDATFKFGSGNNITEIKAGQPVPTIMTIDIQLFETHSPSEFNRFNLASYRAGTLDNF